MRRLSRKSGIRTAGLIGVLMVSLALGGCSSNVGVGMSVGIPIGTHSFISVGSGWH